MAVLWNSGDKTANVTLSGSSLIATVTSAAYGGVRCDTSTAAGKIYYEIIPLAGVAQNIAIGFANATASLSTYIGQDKNSWSHFFQAGSGGVVWFNNGQIMAVVSAAVGQTIGVAFDASALKGWVRVNGGYWNNSSTADPATGTGGFSVATMNAGPYFPVFNSNINGASVQANFGASDFNYAMPSGFSSLDTNVQAYQASSKFLGYGGYAPPQTAADTSKMLGLAPLAPSQNAAVSSKLIGYAILQNLSTMSVGITEGADSVAATIFADASMAVAVTESPDSVSASLNSAFEIAIAVTESPDAVFVALGYDRNLSINVTEAPDTVAMVLEGVGGWLNCPAPNTTWTPCEPSSTTWTECEPATTIWTEED